MEEKPRRGPGRPATGSHRRGIRLPADLLAAWDAATPDQIRDALRKGLLSSE